ncbi:hypothetical protein QBC35DRAFT_178490 [Podospora australis]|uniref:PLD phosphodiesterase domain-containing protein n=1 Tax=Podospora australis TaxID=1536484 RepID=A0AAN7ADB6_9PEZI|nr:hypothetical protein QBC35DRAFT_178490 [Podospora australis]
MSYSSSFVYEFIKKLEHCQLARKNTRDGENDIPDYNISNTADRELLVTSSTLHTFQLGTGASIFTTALIPAIISAEFEVILVTCFWAPSETLSALHDALVKLASHRRAFVDDARAEGARAPPPLSVRICFSSRSVSQKLLHPQSRDGYVYPPSTWQKKLGLPEPTLLESAGIHLEVKSLFFLPFSVMHPKFVIIDRQRALVPSCNVSWEPWLEGCIEITGEAVHGMLSFYSRTWNREVDCSQPFEHDECDNEAWKFDAQTAGLRLIASTAHHRVALAGNLAAASPTVLLPSSHHRNPRFRPFPWQKSPEPPSTPLNVALIELLGDAQRSIYIQTPNLTCRAVIDAILGAVVRGIDVTVVTCRDMMLIEQLVTAGTTTSWCVRSLVRRFRKLEAASYDQLRDLETSRPHLGRLCISYYCSRVASHLSGRDRRPLMEQNQSLGEEPVHSHLKLTIVDREYTVLGSGNMDRASWFTSQELGVLFHDARLASSIQKTVDEALKGRLKLVFDSAVRSRLG